MLIEELLDEIKCYRRYTKGSFYANITLMAKEVLNTVKELRKKNT
jgi:hypothetical protein